MAQTAFILLSQEYVYRNEFIIKGDIEIQKKKENKKIAAVLLKKRMEELSSRGLWVVFLLRDQLLYDIGSLNKKENYKL
jgi:hypothetical protein